jgi:hypothetical protein
MAVRPARRSIAVARGVAQNAIVSCRDVLARCVGASRAVKDNECVLVKALLLPDVCAGRCPDGTACVATQRRRYLVFGKQDEKCDCR